MPEPSNAVLAVRFFRTESDNEPVRAWLKELEPQDKKVIGEDVKTVQFGWPLGMPLVRKMSKDLWEIRIHLHRRIAHILFTVVGGDMVLPHGFVKKSQATPKEDLDLAKERLKQVKKA
jgi:phage-related protein